MHMDHSGNSDLGIVIANKRSVQDAIKHRLMNAENIMNNARQANKIMVEKAKNVAETAREYKDVKKKQKEINKQFIKGLSSLNAGMAGITAQESEELADIKTEYQINTDKKATKNERKNTKELMKLKKELDKDAQGIKLATPDISK